MSAKLKIEDEYFGYRVPLYIPFTVYDVFGYFLPGLVLFLIFYLYECVIEKEIFIRALFSYSKYSITRDIVQLLIISVICYIIGHCIATISVIFHDRIIYSIILTYPLLRLLKIHNKYVSYINKNKNIVLKILLYIKLYYFVFIFLTLMNYHSIICIQKYYNIIIGIPILIILILIFKIKYLKLTFQKILNILSNALQFLRARDFTEEFISNYTKYFSKIFKLNPIKEKTNVYWLSQILIVSTSPRNYLFIENWRNLYSLMRNLSSSFYISSCLGLIFTIFNEINNNDLKLILISIIAMSLAFMSLFRYIYLYENYYTKYIIRTFYFLCKYKLQFTEKTKVKR